MRFKPTEIATIVVAGIAFVGAVVSAFYTYTSRNRELDIELIKLGVGILRADPKETQTNGARGWAIDVIETYSRKPFSAEAKRELLSSKLDYVSALDFTSTYAPDYTHTHTPRPNEPAPQRR
jgi:hypothetical protein